MSIVSYIFTLFLFFSFGYSLSIMLEVKHHIERWGISWLLGLGWGTMIWFLSYLLFNIPFSLGSLFTCLIVANITFWGLVIVTKRKFIRQFFSIRNIHPKNIILYWYKQNNFIKTCTVILAILGILVLLQDVFWPVTDWDALALYDFRAKVIVATGSLQSGVQLGYFFQYPLFTSLLHAATYFTSLGNAKIYYFIIFQAFLAVFYACLRKKTTIEISAFGTLVLATCPLIFYHSFTAYTNLSYIVYACLGIIYLWHWLDNLKPNNLLIGSMLLGLSTWVRMSEPFYYLGLLLLAIGMCFSFYKKYKIKQTLLLVIVGACFIYFTKYPWNYLITILISENLGDPLAIFTLIKNWDFSNVFQRVYDVAEYLLKYSVPVFLWYGLIAVIIIANDIKNKFFSNIIPFLTLLITLVLIFVGTFLTSLWLESWNRIGDSVARMSLFLIPLFIYIIFTSKSWVLTKDKK